MERQSIEGVETDTNKLKSAATVWQLIFGLVSSILLCAAFIFGIKAEGQFNANENIRQDRDIQEIRSSDKEFFKQSQENQMRILDAINELKVKLVDKADRKK